MNLLSHRMRGMQDIIPDESEKWEFIENIMKQEAALYGFKLIRTPVIEQTELFERSAGETSDVVEKEMYTFMDKGGRSVTMRPEGTAGVMRAILENGMHNWVLPLKLMYLSSCYRYEKPQMGRWREFFQFGLEIIGGNSTMADAEIICLAHSIFTRLGLRNFRVEINAIGCEGCQDYYKKNVKKYFESFKNDLCNTCKSRLERNPLRIFDCKKESCKSIIDGAPMAVGYICKDCAEHFQRLKDYTYECGVNVGVNQYLFRGLDYYTHTAFEFIAECDDTELVICGGGRYDNLSKQFGGPKLPSAGLGIGIERLISVIDKQEIELPKPKRCDIYIAPLGAPARLASLKLASKLRSASIRAEVDLVGRFIKAQMKYADKIGARYSMVIGTKEMQEQKAMIKNMSTGKQFQVDIGDSFLEDFMKKSLEDENDMSV